MTAIFEAFSLLQWCGSLGFSILALRLRKMPEDADYLAPMA